MSNTLALGEFVFLSQSIDVATYRAFAARNGGENVPLPP